MLGQPRENRFSCQVHVFTASIDILRQKPPWLSELLAAATNGLQSLVHLLLGFWRQLLALGQHLVLLGGRREVPLHALELLQDNLPLLIGQLQLASHPGRGARFSPEAVHTFYILHFTFYILHFREYLININAYECVFKYLSFQLNPAEY
jgi:hypothetical protein